MGEKDIHDRDQPGLVVRCASAPDVRSVVVAREGRVLPVEHCGSLDGDDVFCPRRISISWPELKGGKEKTDLGAL